MLPSYRSFPRGTEYAVCSEPKSCYVKVPSTKHFTLHDLARASFLFGNDARARSLSDRNHHKHVSILFATLKDWRNNSRTVTAHGHINLV